MLPWPLLQGRWIDGAPTPRIPSCAGECPSPLTSANTRLTEPRETGVHYPITQQRRCEPNTRSNTTGHLTRPAASYKATSTPSGGGHPPRGPRPRHITSQTRTPAGPGAAAAAPVVVPRFIEAMTRIKSMGVSLLIAESNLMTASRVADRLYAIDRGEIIFEGSPRRAFEHEEVMKTIRG